MRLPQRNVPVVRRVSTAHVAGQVEPAFLGGILKKGWNIIKGPAKDLACSAGCNALPGPLKAACRAACSL